MNFINGYSSDTVANALTFFVPRISENPATVLHLAESELTTLYVRYSNDWTGRGYVGDAQQEAAIAAMEALRAECLERLEQRSYG